MPGLLLERMIMKVTLFSTPNCIQCKQTAKQFEKRGIVFDTLNLENHPEILDQFKGLGYTSAPIVLAGNQSWSGFRLSKIEELAQRFEREKRDAQA